MRGRKIVDKDLRVYYQPMQYNWGYRIAIRGNDPELKLITNGQDYKHLGIVHDEFTASKLIKYIADGDISWNVKGLNQTFTGVGDSIIIRWVDKHHTFNFIARNPDERMDCLVKIFDACEAAGYYYNIGQAAKEVVEYDFDTLPKEFHSQASQNLKNYENNKLFRDNDKRCAKLYNELSTCGDPLRIRQIKNTIVKFRSDMDFEYEVIEYIETD